MLGWQGLASGGNEAYPYSFVSFVADPAAEACKKPKGNRPSGDRPGGTSWARGLRRPVHAPVGSARAIAMRIALPRSD